MKDVLLAELVVLFVFNGCSTLPVTVTSLSVNKPRPPLIDGVKPSYNIVPVISILVASQSAVLLRAGMSQEDTAESNVVTPEPTTLIFETEQFVVVGKEIAVPS